MTTGDAGDSDNREALILEATERLIATSGFDAVRLIDIATEAGVSIGSLQHRYRTREGLLVAAVERAAASTLEHWIAAIDGTVDDWERVKILMDGAAMAGPSASRSSLWLELLVASTRHPQVLAIMQRQQELWAGVLGSAIKAGLESGRFESDFSPEDLTKAVLALNDALVVTRIVEPDEARQAHTKTLLQQIVGRLVRLQEQQAPSRA